MPSPALAVVRMLINQVFPGFQMNLMGTSRLVALVDAASRSLGSIDSHYNVTLSEALTFGLSTGKAFMVMVYDRFYHYLPAVMPNIARQNRHIATRCVQLAVACVARPLWADTGFWCANRTRV